VQKGVGTRSQPTTPLVKNNMCNASTDFPKRLILEK